MFAGKTDHSAIIYNPKVTIAGIPEDAERYLLAFVYSWLDEHDLMAVRTEAEKYLMLGALNLVECVAFVGAVNPQR